VTGYIPSGLGIGLFVGTALLVGQLI
jgi:hypothetical protein